MIKLPDFALQDGALFQSSAQCSVPRHDLGLCISHHGNGLWGTSDATAHLVPEL